MWWSTFLSLEEAAFRRTSCSESSKIIKQGKRDFRKKEVLWEARDIGRIVKNHFISKKEGWNLVWLCMVFCKKNFRFVFLLHFVFHQKDEKNPFFFKRPSKEGNLISAPARSNKEGFIATGFAL
jgi:hypothetical protein